MANKANADPEQDADTGVETEYVTASGVSKQPIQLEQVPAGVKSAHVVWTGEKRTNLPGSIRIATVYAKPSRNRSSLQPDFFVRATDHWLVFPHEMQGLTREEILEHKPVDESFFTGVKS